MGAGSLHPELLALPGGGEARRSTRDDSSAEDSLEGNSSVRTVYRVDPLKDPRWEVFLQQHSQASVFHTPGWLEALRRTYGYKSVVYTTSPPGTELTNGVAFCRVSSWLTGHRLVSLPFSDHCEPLVSRAEELNEICAALKREVEKENLKYIELRPLGAHPGLEIGFQKGREFYLHVLNLQASEEELFR
ncbi:MAG TPA: hypothetical protein VHM88_01345, partial [Candidatus Acidoferrales bacterium]|nr:hypothetical protein [Candidatus Acidoferrales bacterium]